jgi:hypothetical protein
MAKQALGRTLEVLLDPGARDATARAAVPGRGVRTLMRGAPRQTWGRRWYFYGGDIVLTGLALFLSWRSPRPLSVGREIVCGLAVALGAMLALAAVWNEEVLRAGAGIMSHRETPE